MAEYRLLPGARREAYQSHVVFYQPTDYGVFVVESYAFGLCEIAPVLKLVPGTRWVT